MELGEGYCFGFVYPSIHLHFFCSVSRQPLTWFQGNFLRTLNTKWRFVYRLLLLVTVESLSQSYGPWFVIQCVYRLLQSNICFFVKLLWIYDIESNGLSPLIHKLCGIKGQVTCGDIGNYRWYPGKPVWWTNSRAITIEICEIAVKPQMNKIRI